MTMEEEFDKLIGELQVTKRQKIALLVLQLTYREMNNIIWEIIQEDTSKDSSIDLADMLDSWAGKVKEEMNNVGTHAQGKEERGQGKSDNSRQDTQVSSVAGRPPDGPGAFSNLKGSSGDRVRSEVDGRGSERPVLRTDTSRSAEIAKAYRETEARRKEEKEV